MKKFLNEWEAERLNQWARKNKHKVTLLKSDHQNDSYDYRVELEQEVWDKYLKFYIVDLLLSGCQEYRRRWSGDTHSDLGGSIDRPLTEEIMEVAAEMIGSTTNKKLLVQLEQSTKFSPGDTVIWDRRNLSEEFWENLSEGSRVLYYGRFGYGAKKTKLFTYICEHSPQSGHCVLMDMDDGRLIPMCHPSEFRLATEEEC